jgi:hypothetical protein
LDNVGASLNDPYRPYYRYSPPYDSPIEDIFAYNFEKYLNPEIFVQPQKEVKTICGVFRLDFAVKFEDRLIGIECDGSEFHNKERDLWRDSLILATGDFDGIYRFTGKNIFSSITECLYLLSKAEPVFFSPRGITNLSTLVDKKIKETVDFYNHQTEDSLILYYVFNPENESENTVHSIVYVDRRLKTLPKNQTPQWVEHFEFVNKCEIKTLDKVIDHYKSLKAE